MPNWETDDNSTDDGVGGGTPRRTIDKCAGCAREIDTTDDPSPTCPCCGNTSWVRVTLTDHCPWSFAGCRGPRASVTEHVCAQCLNTVAIHDRTARDRLVCMCPLCNGSIPPQSPSCPIAPPQRTLLMTRDCDGVSAYVQDCNGRTLYRGDWLMDKDTGFVMRADGIRIVGAGDLNDDPGTYIVSSDGNWNIPQKHAVLITPARSSVPNEYVATCDLEAYRQARMGAAGRPTPAAVGPSVFDKLDWL